MSEYQQRNSRRSDGQIARRGNQTSGYSGEAVYTGFSYLPLDVQSRRDDRILARFEDNTESLSPVEKLVQAVKASGEYLDDAVVAELQAVFSPATLATMVGVFGIYVASHATGVG